MIVLVLAGCSPSVKDRPRASPPAAPVPALDRGFLSEQGEATQRSAEDRRVIWIVRWQAAAMSVEGDAARSGRLKGVTGTVVQKGKPVCEFRADEGEADGSAEVLTLRGSVRVVHSESTAVLTCGRLVYRGKTERFEARDDVVLEKDAYRVGPMDAMWASADLSQGGTPPGNER